MFTIDPKITEKDLKGKNMFKVLLSMNNHQVATPEMSLEEARSYVFFFREGRNRLSAYIGLHLLLTDRKLIYSHSENPFLEDHLLKIEDEARDFAEYLGAMMDEVDFASMSDLEKDRWIENQGIFSTKTPPEVAAAPASQPSAAPEQPGPATGAISTPEPPPPAAPSVQPLPKAPEEAKEQTREVPVKEAARQDVQSQAPPRAAAKRRQEIAQKEARTGLETPPKQTAKRTFSATGVVSRDREALARLLTSF